MTTLARFVIDELQRELVYQKHIATNTLHDSVEHRINTHAGSGVAIDFYAEFYGAFVNRGRQRNAKPVPIEPLVQWVIDKAIANNRKDAKRIAFAIRTKIQREGIPTNNSKRISGRRTHWVDYTMDSLFGEIIDSLENRTVRNIERWMEQTVARANAQLK